MKIGRREFLGSLAVQSARTHRPNVLWLMTDEQRPDSIGCYGSAWAKTPCLDELASEGTLYEEAYTPSPVCVPARSSLLTGIRGSRLGVLHNRAPRMREGTRFLTWAFADAGYRTASFGKKHYFVDGRQAFETEAGRATDKVVSPIKYLRECRDCDAVQYPGLTLWLLGGRFPAPIEQTAEYVNTQLAINWLSQLSRRDSFFLRISWNAPHTPVVVPEEFCNTIEPDSVQLPFPSEEELTSKPPYERGALRDYQGAHRLSRSQVLKARQYYYERVSFLDSQIARLLDWMRPRGLLDNTVIAFVSDHGSGLADHGLFQKQTFYRQVGGVPFLLWYPNGVSRGRRVELPVSTISLAPAMLDLAGLRGGEKPRESGPVFSEVKFGYRDHRDDDRLVMIRDGDFKLIVFHDPADPEKFAGRREGSLYNLGTDPGETRNLFTGTKHQATIDRLLASITKRDGSHEPIG